MKGDKISTKKAIGETLIELGKENENIFVVDADIGASTTSLDFQKVFPERHIDSGIAEQNACGMAAGLAACGKIPFVSTYCVFGSMRMGEQIRQSVCYPNLNVKFVCSHGGLTPGRDGATHQATEDLGVLTSIPNMTVAMPADVVAAKALIRKAAEQYGPVFLRMTRDAVEVIYEEDQQFELGKAVVLREGTDLSIIANGDTVRLAIQAAEELARRGIEADVLDMHTVKPLDKAAVLNCMRKTGKIVTVEDHNIINGLGTAVASVVCENGGCTVKKIGIPDRFGESASYDELMQMFGITVENIVKTGEELVNGQ